MTMLTIIGLPYAGGGSHAYQALQRRLPGDVPWVTLEPPGRGRRIDEPPLSRMDEAADDLFPLVAQQARTGPYALFGHGSGALLAHALMERIAATPLPAPLRLFVSGCAAPHIPHPDPVGDLPDELFLQRLQKIGGLAAELSQTPALLDLFIPVLRADVCAAETYLAAPSRPYPAPITVLAGASDTVTRQQAGAWELFSQAPLRLRIYAGGHFFLFDQARRVMQDLLGDLELSRGMRRQAFG